MPNHKNYFLLFAFLFLCFWANAQDQERRRDSLRIIWMDETIFLLQDGKSTQGTGGEKGTGLGLHLAQGTIRVASSTTFIIQLPKAA